MQCLLVCWITGSIIASTFLAIVIWSNLFSCPVKRRRSLFSGHFPPPAENLPLKKVIVKRYVTCLSPPIVQNTTLWIDGQVLQTKAVIISNILTWLYGVFYLYLGERRARDCGCMMPRRTIVVQTTVEISRHGSWITQPKQSDFKFD